MTLTIQYKPKLMSVSKRDGISCLIKDGNRTFDQKPTKILAEVYETGNQIFPNQKNMKRNKQSAF